MDFSSYPLDTQTCRFNLSSARHFSDELSFNGTFAYSASQQDTISYSVRSFVVHPCAI